MGANQSAAQRASLSGAGDNNGQVGGILVVNQTPGTRDTEHNVPLPKRIPPILSLESNEIDPKRHKPNIDQLDPRLWIEFALNISEFVDSRRDLVAKRQNLLREKIVRIDDHIQKFTDSYVSEQHQALARLNDDRRKVSEIDKMLQKCTVQSELCVSMLNKLNFLLPEEAKLEPLEPQKTVE